MVEVKIRMQQLLGLLSGLLTSVEPANMFMLCHSKLMAARSYSEVIPCGEGIHLLTMRADHMTRCFGHSNCPA
jgi:hypothetical protein